MCGAGVLLRERATLNRFFPALDQTRVRFARVRKGLPLPILDVEQPFFPSRLTEANDGALAVVEDVRGLVDDEVCERIVLREVLRRNVAGGFFAHADEAWRVLSEQLRPNAREVKVRERPRRAIEGALEQERLDVCACHEDDGSLEHGEHQVLLRLRE